MSFQSLTFQVTPLKRSYFKEHVPVLNQPPVTSNVISHEE